MAITYHPGRPTARELLTWAAGEEHATHTVVARGKSQGQLWFRCSCGITCIVHPRHAEALRNVGEYK